MRMKIKMMFFDLLFILIKSVLGGLFMGGAIWIMCLIELPKDDPRILQVVCMFFILFTLIALIPSIIAYINKFKRW